MVDYYRDYLFYLPYLSSSFSPLTSSEFERVEKAHELFPTGLPTELSGLGFSQISILTQDQPDYVSGLLESSSLSSTSSSTSIFDTVFGTASTMLESDTASTYNELFGVSTNMISPISTAITGSSPYVSPTVEPLMDNILNSINPSITGLTDESSPYAPEPLPSFDPLAGLKNVEAGLATFYGDAKNLVYLAVAAYILRDKL